MRVIVVGLGVQGEKRRRVAGADCVATVDIDHADADYRSVEDVPLDSFDAALLCVPDAPKVELIRYLLTHCKHVLVEKPLWAEDGQAIQELETLARANETACYTAYNHRFEPHFVRMRDLISSGDLGQIYHCRIFYGNGTARLVRDSEWRDQGAGVLPDLGSHLLDTLDFWFDDRPETFELVSANRFENRAYDHVVLSGSGAGTVIQLEMTLLMWRNDFSCDVLAENGSAHIHSLCKWGPTTFTYRRRVLPSGRPPEESVTLVQDDPTWQAEYEHFRSLCAVAAPADLSSDLWIHELLSGFESSSADPA